MEMRNTKAHYTQQKTKQHNGRNRGKTETETLRENNKKNLKKKNYGEQTQTDTIKTQARYTNKKTPNKTD